jgi:hypothetical protein
MSTSRSAGLPPLEASVRSFLFLLVEDRIERGDGDELLPRWKNHRDVSVLRSLGYIEGTDRLTDKAFAAFFSTFDTITCPDEIQRCMDELRITGIQWRRAKGVILQRIRHAHGHGMTFPLAMTIFVRDGAALPTWYHELGHITFQSIKEDRGSIARLLASAMASFPVKSSSEIKDAPGITEGSYMLIDGRYLGLDHSGMDAVEDEIWAVVFERYHCGSPLPQNLLRIVEDIIGSITAR